MTSTSELTCLHPDRTALTSYRYGCRCERCRTAQREAMQRSIDRASGTIDDVCALGGCTKPRRPLQGARYCDEHARVRQGRKTNTDPATAGRSVHTVQCRACGTLAEIRTTSTYAICARCRLAALSLIGRAREHHVPESTLIQWLNDPTCNLCHRQLYLGKNKGGSCGFAIDHAHDCCPEGRSCGHCIRGLLCGACNTSLGGLEALLRRAPIEELLLYIGRGTP